MSAPFLTAMAVLAVAPDFGDALPVADLLAAFVLGFVAGFLVALILNRISTSRDRKDGSHDR